MNIESMLAAPTKIRLHVRLQFALPNVHTYMRDKQEKRNMYIYIHANIIQRARTPSAFGLGAGVDLHTPSRPRLCTKRGPSMIHMVPGQASLSPRSLFASAFSAEFASPLAALPRRGPAGEALSVCLECACVSGSLSSRVLLRTLLLRRRPTAYTAP